MGNECNCLVVWTFFSTTLLWNCMKTDLFQSCGHCWVFHTCRHIQCSNLATLSFSILNSSAGIPSPLLALLVVMLPAATAAAKPLQSCPTLCDPRDGSPPGSAVPGVLQARTLEWVAISFSNAWKWKVKVKSLIRVRPSATPWTAAYQAPPSMGFSRQEYWSGVPVPSLVTLPKTL